VHDHPRTHEVLGIARGSGRVQFGGPKGKTMMLKAGDVVILPAGTGHRALSTSKDLLVIGAYPARGKYDEYEGSTREHDKALLMIPKVALPSKDPVLCAGCGSAEPRSGTNVPKRSPSSVEVIDSEEGRVLVLTYADGEVVRRTIDPSEKPRRKPRKPVARARTEWINKTRNGL